VSIYDKSQSFSEMTSVPPETSDDADLESFIFNLLIDENARLMQKIQELTSQKKLADEITEEVQQKADALGSLAEKEVNSRVDNIIGDAEEKAKADADRILAEATRQAEAIGTLKERQANDRAASIVREAETRAKIEAEKILAEAKREAEKIVEEKTQFATQQGLLIINKAEETALSIIKDVQRQAQQIKGRSNQKPRS
jgi:vacuolar-type H+-ATPase subunit H